MQSAVPELDAREAAIDASTVASGLSPPFSHGDGSSLVATVIPRIKDVERSMSSSNRAEMSDGCVLVKKARASDGIARFRAAFDSF